jgi:GntR family transcriptional regulator of arabinose operon
MRMTSEFRSKHGEVYAALLRQLREGRWKPGDRIPTEAELVGQFGVSRITVVRAVRDLEARGLVERRRGAGTFVRRVETGAKLSFGLLIPDLGETEVLEPICHGMMTSPLARDHVLVWGSAGGGGESSEERAWTLCRQFVDRRVSGVFFAPLEFSESAAAANHRIARALDAARIPIVLLDRGIAPFPEFDDYDLAALDNRRAGFAITAHVIVLGATRVAFVASPNAAATVDEREAGYREALYRHGVAVDRALVRRMNPDDDAAAETFMRAEKPDAIVCANDRTAGQLMHALRRAGRHVPRDVRLVGIDDVAYAALLPVPLTSFRQPTREIGDAAMELMLARVARGDLPPRDTRLNGELVVRESCGARGLAI